MARSLDPRPDEPPPGYVLLQLPSQAGRTLGRITQLTGLALLIRVGREVTCPPARCRTATQTPPRSWHLTATRLSDAEAAALRISPER